MPYMSYDLILKQTHHSSSKEEIRQPESSGDVCSQCRNTRVIYEGVRAGEDACRRLQSCKNIVAHLKDTGRIWSIRLVTVSPTHLRWSHKPNCEEILRNKGLANPSMFFAHRLSSFWSHMTVSLSSSTTGMVFSTWKFFEGSSSCMWSSWPEDGMEFSETEPFFTYPGRFRWPLMVTGPRRVVRCRARGPRAVTFVTLVWDTMGP